MGIVQMIKKLFIFIALFLALVAAAEKKKVCCPDNAKEYCAPSGKRYFVFGCDCKMNREDAYKACCAMGARLADLCEGPDFTFLTRHVNWVSWINTFNGSNFGGAALALFPHGAIAVPCGGAWSLQGAICEC